MQKRIPESHLPQFVLPIENTRRSGLSRTVE